MIYYIVWAKPTSCSLHKPAKIIETFSQTGALRHQQYIEYVIGPLAWIEALRYQQYIEYVVGRPAWVKTYQI